MAAALLGLAAVAVVTLAVIAHRNSARTPVELPATPTATHAVSALATDRIVFDSDRGGNYEIYAMGRDGSGVRALTDDPAYDSWWPQLSPDRLHLLFYRVPKGKHDNDLTANALWMSNSDGTDAHEVLPAGAYGWVEQGHAMWSPDGQQLVMFAGSKLSPQLWVTRADGRDAKQLTHRGGVNIDPSWSPDGSGIAFVGCPGSFCTPGRYEVYVLHLGTGDLTRVTTDQLRDNDPVFSPDGRRLAWLTETSTQQVAGEWNVRSAAPDGSDPRDITHDGNITSRPAYTPDGKSIFFHRLVYGAQPAGFQIWRADADGANLAPAGNPQPGNNEYPTP
ncbi:MAG: TolB protein [Frankiaceae bacterium]|nr:TolB protein [Frankiaceae bacterium]